MVFPCVGEAQDPKNAHLPWDSVIRWMQKEHFETDFVTKNTAGKPESQIALTIAGFDPSSGAGVTADLKVFAAHGVYGISCITALTVQSTLGVRQVEPVSPATVRATLDCLHEDAPPWGIKIGMLATEGIVGEVADFLAGAGISRERVVLDPVLLSSSGKPLLTADGVNRLRASLLARVGWITPNIDELGVLTGAKSVQRDGIPSAAARLQEMAAEAGNPELHVLVTGGHLDSPDDFLRMPDGTEVWLRGEWVETTSTHGTGCALSSALLCRIMEGKSPRQAAEDAKVYVTEALRAAHPVGRGRGPMHHLFRLV